MMDPRSARVLQGLVAEYIRGAEPVGSVRLARRLRLNVSPATVRALLHDLEAAGYLIQPHTSAGRIPTDSGYRYYVDHVAEDAVPVLSPSEIEAVFRRLQADYQLARAATKLLARLTHAIAVSSFLSRGEIQETGLHEVLQQPEGESVPTVKELSAVLEKVEAYLDELGADSAEPRTYIGRENPFFPAEHTSIMVKTVLTDQGPVVLAVVGPKRMPYQRNRVLLDILGQLLQRHA